MPKLPPYLEIGRQNPPVRPVAERLKDFRAIEQMMTEDQLVQQSQRCQDCGIPFCHSVGCPIQNLIPDFNARVARRQWRKALELLHAVNSFPEITGRICPAPCEASCSLALQGQPVAVRAIELQIVEKGWQEGWIKPEPAAEKSGFKIAVIGSGPSGLAAAQWLARSGHDVVVFEKSDRPGGILRYGIPDYKLEKWVLDRRIRQLEAEGVRFKLGVEAGTDLSVKYLITQFDSILLATGAGVPRDLPVPGRELAGIHFAMPFLTQQNRINAGDSVPPEERLSAEGRRVLVIGGGDTGSDCIGTSLRQGAVGVVQIEILPRPPETRAPSNPWPQWPNVLRTSSSHEEGCERLWSVATKEFLGDDQGRVRAARCVRLDWRHDEGNGRMIPHEIPDSEFDIPCDMVLLAMGFVHTEHGPLVRNLGLKTDARGNILVDTNHMTSVNGVFAAGDSVRGASLVAHAIVLGRRCAQKMDEYLRNSR
ncbi:MAG: glutamate synthase subunit beta [Candidatus Sumerlaeia bacterium]